MKCTVYVQGAAKEQAVEDPSAGFSVEEDGDYAVLVGPTDLRARVRAASLVDFHVSLTTKTVVANYVNKNHAAYCCVTCNGWTYCGESACCDMGGGNWLCC